MEKILRKTEYGEIFEGEEFWGDANIGLRVETEIGTLSAYPSKDPDNPGICLMFIPKGVDYEIDIVYTEVPKGENVINLYSYEDPYIEDWTRKSKISYEDVKTALNEN